MNRSGLKADQLYTWSDNHAPHIAQTALVCFAKAPATAGAQVAAAGSFAARFAYRTLQTLWQAGMQMCPRSRSRAQVLPLRELFRPKTANGLRAPGVSRPDYPKSARSPSGPQNLRGDLRDQSRIVASPRGDLSDHEPLPTSVLTICAGRHANGRSVACQYACRLAEERPRILAHCGDRR